MALFLRVETEIEWIDDISETPILGHLFVFALIFIPAVLMSFVIQGIVPGFHNDVGFTKAMIVLLPLWNLGLWLGKIKIYTFFIPSWILLGVISLVKGYMMISGLDDGQ